MPTSPSTTAASSARARIVHSGAVIGADGFGMAEEDGRWLKIPQIGRVVIGADVEIGANTTIDRGAIDDTVIEDDVKLDNQIQIGHNCRIGAHTAIAGCVGIAGSTRDRPQLQDRRRRDDRRAHRDRRRRDDLGRARWSTSRSPSPASTSAPFPRCRTGVAPGGIGTFARLPGSNHACADWRALEPGAAPADLPTRARRSDEDDKIRRMDIKEIMRFLPHRYPFLLVDRVDRARGEQVDRAASRT